MTLSIFYVQSVSPGIVATEMAAAAGFTPEEATAFYSNNPALKAEDVAATVEHIITAPQHVEVGNCHRNKKTLI